MARSTSREVTMGMCDEVTMGMCDEVTGHV